jgi:hypothetical protein
METLWKCTNPNCENQIRSEEPSLCYDHQRIADLKAQLAEAIELLKTHQDPCAPRHEAVDRFLIKAKDAK